MGRGKIEMKRISNYNSRQVTFGKRRAGLFKKACELAILCDAQVAVIVFSETGEIYAYCSENTNMKSILSRYLNSDRRPLKKVTSEHNLKEAKQAGNFENEIARLKRKEMQLVGKGLNRMDLNELRQLEQQLNEGMQSVRERKEQLILDQLQQSRAKEQRAMLESDILHKQMEELRGLRPLTDHPAAGLLENYLPERAKSPAKNNFQIPDDDSDTTLHLGPPSGFNQKRKTPEL